MNQDSYGEQIQESRPSKHSRSQSSPQVNARLRSFHQRSQISSQSLKKRKAPKALIQKSPAPQQQHDPINQEMGDAELSISAFISDLNDDDPFTVRVSAIGENDINFSLDQQRLQGGIQSQLQNQIRENMRDSVFSKESALQKKKTIEQSAQKIELTKNKTFNEMLNLLRLVGNRMFGFDENELEREEPEKSGTNYGKYMKKLSILFVFFYTLVVVVVAAFKKIGDEKIQTSGSEMMNSYDFDLIRYPVQELLPIHWFIELNMQSVTDRMDCLINNNPERCFEKDEQTCRSQFQVKGKDYQNCMMKTYKMYSKDQSKFCKNLYYDSDTYFPTERKNSLFLTNYHECLQAAGQPRGWKYCYDTYGFGDTQNIEALYKCFDSYKVDKMLYAEDKCLVDSPPIFEIKKCIDDLTNVDSNGVSCTTYHQNPSWCGLNDTEDFVSLDMCCACNGGTIGYANMTSRQEIEIDQSQEDYKTCLINNGAENIAKRFDCDLMNTTYDQFKYRSSCFDDGGVLTSQGEQTETDSTDSTYEYCLATIGLIKERLKCYENIETIPVQQGCIKQELRGQSNQYQYEWIEAACVSGNNIGNSVLNQSVQECAGRCNGVPECKGFEYGAYHGGDNATADPPRMCLLQSHDDPTGCNGTYWNNDLYLKKYHGQEEKALEEFYQKLDDCACHSSCTTCGFSDQPTSYEECLSCRNSDFHPAYGKGSTSFGIGYCDIQQFQEHVIEKQQRIFEWDEMINTTFSYPEDHVSVACREGRLGEYKYHYDYACIHRCNYQDTPRFGSCMDGFEFSAEFVFVNSLGFDICATICIPKETDPDQDELQKLSDSNINSLGFCETFLLAGEIQPSLQNITQCYEDYTLAQNLPQMCSCEENGSKFCDFKACTSGTCQSCESLYAEGDCDLLGLSSAGARDCKLRCFNSYDRDFNDNEFYCGQVNKHVVTSLTEIPEKERFKVCHTFYPFSNQLVPIAERDECYQYFGIEISITEIYHECHEKLDDLSEYQKCLVMLGTQAKADTCWTASQSQSVLDFYFSGWSLEKGVILFDTKTFFPDCMAQFNQTVSVQSCYINFIFYDHPNDWYSGVKNCLQQFDLLISQEDKCFYDQYPDMIGQASEPVLTAANINCSLEILNDTEQYQCTLCQESTKSMEFGGQIMNALRQGRPVNEIINFLLTQNPQCKRREGVFDKYEQCMADVQSTTIISELNQNLKAKKQRIGQDFTPVESDVEYCKEMFASEDEIDSRIMCHVIIKKPLGPEQCSLLQRVTDYKAYEFNRYYKYSCMYQEGALLDSDASYCLDQESIELKKFYEIEDCLKTYENSGQMPILTQERSQYVYSRGSDEDLSNQERIIDRQTNFTTEQIEKFICENQTSLHFVSSPYQVMEDNEFYEMNQFEIELECSIFEYANMTRDNLIVYYRFSNETLAQKSNTDDIEGPILYTEDFNMSKLIVNRTDQNQQYFQIKLSEDLDLIQVQSHKVYNYESKSGALTFEMNSHDDYLKLTSDPMIMKVLETYPQVISQQLMPDKIIPAQSLVLVEENANVTKKILGLLPYEFKDFVQNKIKVYKISETIKPVEKEELRREEKNQINNFKVNIEFDFTQVVVKQSYFNTLDIFSELGGLSASVGGILTKLGVLFLIQYNYLLSSMIKRKYQHTLKLQEIKQYLKLLPQIEKIIKEKLGQTESDTEKTQLQKDLSSLEELQVKDYEDKYDSTTERYDSFRLLLGRYIPNLLDSKAIFEHQKNENKDDRFELIEIDENEMKNQLHQSRANMPLGDILFALRERISFFGVYNQVDKINHSKLMIKKLKYTIKLEREMREQLEGEVQEKTDKIEQLSEQQEKQKIEVESQGHLVESLLKRIESIEKQKHD